MSQRLTNFFERLSAAAPFKLRLGNALARRVAAYMVTQGHTDLNHGVKEIISVGLAVTPEDGVRVNALLSELDTLRKNFLKKQYQFSIDTSRELESQILKMSTPHEQQEFIGHGLLRAQEDIQRLENELQAHQYPRG